MPESESPIQRDIASSLPALPEELVSLIAAPPVIRGEDPELYETLLHKVVEAVLPQDTLECLWAVDIASAAWERLRANSMRAQLFEVTRRQATANVLSDLLRHEGGSNLARQLKCDAIAAEWLQQGEDGEAKLTQFLAGYGLGPDVITAEIYRLRADVLERIDRMAAAADRRRDLVILEIERRRRDRADEFRAASERVVEHEPAADLPSADRQTGKPLARRTKAERHKG